MRWALSYELFDQLKQLEDVCFVFSGWSDDGFVDELTRYCAGAEHIVFHLGTKSRADLNYMVANSDAGLAVYDPQDENVRQMGLSSGKLHKFLSLDVPVVCNPQPFLSAYLEDRGWGLSSKTEGIAETLDHLLSNSSQYKENIARTYAIECDFEAAYERVVNSLSNPGR